MSNQEIKGALKELAEAPQGTKRIKRAYTQIAIMSPVWLQAQQTLIDQQAQEIERQMERKYVRMRERDAYKDSLELAVKALEEIHEADIPTEYGFDYAEYYYKVSEIAEKFMIRRGMDEGANHQRSLDNQNIKP